MKSRGFFEPIGGPCMGVAFHNDKGPHHVGTRPQTTRVKVRPVSRHKLTSNPSSWFLRWRRPWSLDPQMSKPHKLPGRSIPYWVSRSRCKCPSHSRSLFTHPSQHQLEVRCALQKSCLPPNRPSLLARSMCLQLTAAGRLGFTTMRFQMGWLPAPMIAAVKGSGRLSAFSWAPLLEVQLAVRDGPFCALRILMTPRPH